MFPEDIKNVSGRLRNCPRCAGAIIFDKRTGDSACVNCGYEVPTGKAVDIAEEQRSRKEARTRRR